MSCQRTAELLEPCRRVADRILLGAKRWRVFVRIEKLDRGPGALVLKLCAPGMMHPAISRRARGPASELVYLSTEAIRIGLFWRAGWISCIINGAFPLILCVGVKMPSAPQLFAHKMARAA